MAKNKRQPYAVSEKAGHQTSAESWGTGTYNTQLAGSILPYLAGQPDFDSDAYTPFKTRSCCCSYSSCLRRWYPPRRSSRLRQPMPLRSNVRSYESVAQVASEDQSQPEVSAKSSNVAISTKHTELTISPTGVLRLLRLLLLPRFPLFY